MNFLILKFQTLGILRINNEKDKNRKKIEKTLFLKNVINETKTRREIIDKKIK